LLCKELPEDIRVNDADAILEENGAANDLVDFGDVEEISTKIESLKEMDLNINKI